MRGIMEKMNELDIEQFWKDDTVAHRENCFAVDAPQVALGIGMNDECFGPELGIKLNPWSPNPPDLMRECAKRYNDKAEKIVGRRLVSEEYPGRVERFPYIKRLGEIFEGCYFYKDGTEYLEGFARTPGDLEKLLDRVERMDIESFVIPEDWNKKIRDIYEKTGLKPELGDFGRDIRGPVTLATSIMGVDNFLFLWYDAPELLRRFSDVLGDAIMGLYKTIDKICGYNEENKPHGFSFSDDNCCLTTPELYEAFGFPILKKIFDYWSPDENDKRYQHSDSAMGHLLPILGCLKLTGVNFGPTVLYDEIRTYMPKARIDGCLAPYTFMRNDREGIVAQVKRDCQMAIESGKKGLNLSTAGSVDQGSLLSSLHLVMQTIQNFGRYLIDKGTWPKPTGFWNKLK
jgi:uroporphyrinogen decarboxylase